VYRVGVGAFVMRDGNFGIGLWARGRARMTAKVSGWRFCSFHQRRGVRVRAGKRRPTWAQGIINLARNIGASVGIATVTTMLDRRAQFHQSRLMERVTISARRITTC